MTPRKEGADRIPLDECVKGRLYDISSRSLGPRAIYDGNEGFVGLRHEMISVCLFTEIHWDKGPPYGTVFQIKDTGIDLPIDVPLSESPGTVDRETGRWVAFKSSGRGIPGHWYFTDTGVVSEDIKPVGKHNDALYDWLWANGANKKHWDRPTPE